MTATDLRKVDHNGVLVEPVGVALDDRDGADVAVSDAGAETVAVAVADELRLAVNELNGTLGAGRDAITAPVAEFLVDLDDLTHGHAGPPELDRAAVSAFIFPAVP